MLQDWKQQDVTVGDASMHVVSTGGAGKPALVLAHGFSDNGLCWQPSAEELESRFNVIMPDARGHGLSARVKEGQVIDPAADLAGLLGVLGVGRVILGGHSMGAMTAAALAARFPSLVSALVLEDPPWRAIPPVDAPRGGLRSMSDFFYNLVKQTPQEAMAQCRREHPAWPEIFVQRWCEGKYQLDLTIFSTSGMDWDIWPQLVPAIQCPTLMITADPDKGGIITPEIAAQVVGLNPRFRVAHIPGAGHHVRFEQYAAYRQILNDFLTEVA
jgi:N-formylmaleamate deformylase